MTNSLTRSLLMLALSLTLPAAAAVAQANSSTAFERAQHLRRGINTSDWFAQSPNNYTAERLRTYTTEDDLKLIRKLGFDHIRLSVDATPLVAWQRQQQAGVAFVTELDRVLAAANADGLAVILDVHPEDPYKATLLTGSDGVQRFASLWRALAGHFSGTDPRLVFFEIMNEPEQTDAFRWVGIETVVAEQIRAAAPRHTLIAAGAHYSGLGDLLSTEPLPDANVIYTFHDYEPFTFTHQGASWANIEVEPLHGIPYPSTPANVRASEAEEPSLASEFYVQQYGLDRWDAARVDSTIAFAQRWSDAHHVPVYCGEFGVYRAHSPAAARVQWLHDMRVAFEKHGIGWAMWDYSDSFGLVTKQNGTTTVDPAVATALGLKPAI